MARPEKIRLGELLVRQKLLSETQLQLALEEQKKSGRKLGRFLVENGLVSEDQIAEAIAKQLDIPFIRLKNFTIKPDTTRLLPEMQARRFRALVLENRGDQILIGMADPTDLVVYDEIARIVKNNIELAVINENELLQTIDRVYRKTDEITDLARELGQDLGDSYIDFASLNNLSGAEDAPVVKLLQSVFDDATQVRASDIHIEP
ncbi:MAG: GspE/PulE family protein, partial [Burkholderiales bacterium]